MSLFEELKRRNVFRVALAYLVLGWLVLQVADVLVDALELPVVWSKAVVGLLVIGAIPAVVFSWVYELTPDGLKKESEIPLDQSITGHTSKKLNSVIVFLLMVAIGLFVFDRFFADQPVAVPEFNASTAENGDGNERRPSVAVLAFDNMSADAENEYFADGISEEILNLLADVSDLSVASRTSAFAFKGTDTPIPEIASTLRVRYVLEGSVRKAGDQVRVTAQLIDATTDRHLWSETFDRALRDIFTIQDEIATAIGTALQVELLGKGGIQVRSESIDPVVYNQFLEARFLLRRRNNDSLAEGNRLLIDIVAAEPRFARAHVMLGEAYLLNSNQGRLVAPELALALANMHASLASSLDPGLGGIDMILGNIAQEKGNFLEALARYDKAIELEPEEPRPYHWRGWLYGRLGYGDLCTTDLERALLLDAQNPNVHFALASCLLTSGEFDRTIELAVRGAGLGNPSGYTLAIIAEHQRGDQIAALGHLRKYLESSDALSGERPESLEIVRESWEGERAPSELTQDELSKLSGEALLLLDEEEEMWRQFSVATSDKNAAILWGQGYAKLRRDQRFVDVLERAGFFNVWRKLGPPSDCRSSGDSFTCGAES